MVALWVITRSGLIIFVAIIMAPLSCVTCTVILILAFAFGSHRFNSSIRSLTIIFSFACGLGFNDLSKFSNAFAQIRHMPEAFKLRGKGLLGWASLFATRLTLNPECSTTAPGDDEVSDAIASRGFFVHAIVRIGPAQGAKVAYDFIVKVTLGFNGYSLAHYVAQLVSLCPSSIHRRSVRVSPGADKPVWDCAGLVHGFVLEIASSHLRQ